jgi:hypothetical protein
MLGTVIVSPSAWSIIKERAFSAGDLGLFLVIAYVAGHLTQAVGNVLESLWWRAWGGWPTDWVRSGKHAYLAGSQVIELRRRIQQLLALPEISSLPQVGNAEWFGISRQIYSLLSKTNQTSRVDTFRHCVTV